MLNLSGKQNVYMFLGNVCSEELKTQLRTQVLDWEAWAAVAGREEGKEHS